MELKRLSGKHKNSKILYYFKRYSELLLPVQFFLYKKNCLKLLNNSIESVIIHERVSYYNKLHSNFSFNNDFESLGSIYKKKKRNTYYFDFHQYSRFFQLRNKVSVLFGDITFIPSVPSITKSRPINGDNTNSVLFKLNKIRHFLFIKDSKSFIDKKDLLISRGKVHPLQENRIRFLDLYFGHPLCDIGKVNVNALNTLWLVNRMTIDKQLDYKFILSLEGNDVATNLKWIMSSNSIAVMPKPKFETWFMEGTLVPNYHYIVIKDDFSDLEDQLKFYIKNTDKALQIIRNANNYVAQFKNKKREDAICFMVLKKYFDRTGQDSSLKN